MDQKPVDQPISNTDVQSSGALNLEIPSNTALGSALDSEFQSNETSARHTDQSNELVYHSSETVKLESGIMKHPLEDIERNEEKPQNFNEKSHMTHFGNNSEIILGKCKDYDMVLSSKGKMEATEEFSNDLATVLDQSLMSFQRIKSTTRDHLITQVTEAHRHMNVLKDLLKMDLQQTETVDLETLSQNLNEVSKHVVQTLLEINLKTLEHQEVALIQLLNDIKKNFRNVFEKKRELAKEEIEIKENSSKDRFFPGVWTSFGIIGLVLAIFAYFFPFSNMQAVNAFRLEW